MPLAARLLQPLAAGLALLLALHGGASAAQSEPFRLTGLRGAITAPANTPEAIRGAVQTLMRELMARNQLQPDRVVSATFTATADLDAQFPASAARQLQGWDGVALLDMQQLAVRGDLPRCIRVLLLAWLPERRPPAHVYLGEAARLRPDRMRPAIPSDQRGAPAPLSPLRDER